LGVSFGQCWFVARVKGHTDPDRRPGFSPKTLVRRGG
jgi:hypothetical protein